MSQFSVLQNDEKSYIWIWENLWEKTHKKKKKRRRKKKTDDQEELVFISGMKPFP